MIPGTTHRGKLLRCKVIETPYQSPNTHFIVEDDLGDIVLVGVYGDIGASPQYAKTFFAGRTLLILEPYLKIAQSGDWMIRVDNPPDIINGPKDIGNKSPKEWREFGNEFFRTDPLIAEECYVRSLEECKRADQAGVSLSLLLCNRALARSKTGDLNLSM